MPSISLQVAAPGQYPWSEIEVRGTAKFRDWMRQVQLLGGHTAWRLETLKLYMTNSSECPSLLCPYTF